MPANILASPLLPESPIPSIKVLQADAIASMSDIFPAITDPHNLGMLGDYRNPVIRVPRHSPLSPAMVSLIEAGHELDEQPPGDGRLISDDVSRGLMAVRLQTHLVLCIDKAFTNLVRIGDQEPYEAVTEINHYIETMDTLSYHHYASHRNDLRQERLGFEWLSARAVTNLLEQRVQPASTEIATV